MEAIAFDTHSFVKRLTKAGMPEPQAEVLAEEQSRLLEYKLASKQDLKQLETTLKKDIAESKIEILKWMFGTLLGQTAVLAALIKLF